MIRQPNTSKMIEVMVTLKGDTAAAMNGARTSALRDRKESLMEMQRGFITRAQGMSKSMRVLGTTQIVANAVFLKVSPDAMAKLAKDPLVARVTEVVNYELDLSETVPYIGATALHAGGFDGSGVRVAVLDSGIDYFHAAFGGSGDPADYAADDPTVIEGGSFPTAKVVGGFDFVGQVWPNGDLAPDPDPVDHGGHGSHVADIIAGNLGVAPGASLYAVQVCSAVATSCSGVALIQAMDFAVDPNGDGDPSDHVDLINMSLGSNYGQPFDDDLAFAVENAAAIGTLTVASAGNSGDRPLVTGTPAGSRSALSVAQTSVPSELLHLMTVIAPASAAGDHIAVHQAWSPDQTAVVEGPVVYGNGAGGNLNGCAPFAPGSVAGQIVLVNRGACNFSDKIRNISLGGGAIGIIGLIAAGEPFSGAFGGGAAITIPGYMITLASANAIRSGGVVRFDPAHVLSLAGSMASTSSRGPRNYDNMLKPEIGAPGASVSALAGTGIDTAAFGGTSGAAPMVTGSAALLIQSRSVSLPGAGIARPLVLKSLLMNSAETDIRRDFTGVLAEVSRIGAGEVRVDRSVGAPVVAFSVEDNAPALSYGLIDVARGSHVVKRRIKLINTSNALVHYNISRSFRFASDASSGALQLSTPSFVNVPANGQAQVDVFILINGNALGANAMSSGSSGADPATLNAMEFDGYITFDDGLHPIHVPWHIIPRKAASVGANPPRLQFRPGMPKTVTLLNRGPGDAQNEAFSLIGVSANIPEGPAGGQAPTPDLRAVGVNTTPVPAGVCSDADSFIWSFAINTHERQTHLVPVIHDLFLDTNQDGTADWEIANIDLGFLQTGALSGQVATWSIDQTTGAANAFFFAEHATNAATTVLRVCAEQLGMSAADLGVTQVDVTVNTTDFFFGGPGDSIGTVTIVPGGERFTSTVDATLAGGASGSLVVTDNGANAGNANEIGVLLVTASDFGAGARGAATQATEAIVLPLNGVALPF